MYLQNLLHAVTSVFACTWLCTSRCWDDMHVWLCLTWHMGSVDAGPCACVLVTLPTKSSLQSPDDTFGPCFCQMGFARVVHLLNPGILCHTDLIISLKKKSRKQHALQEKGSENARFLNAEMGLTANKRGPCVSYILCTYTGSVPYIFLAVVGQGLKS